MGKYGKLSCLLRNNNRRVEEDGFNNMVLHNRIGDDVDLVGEVFGAEQSHM